MRRGLITDGDCVYVHVHVWQRSQRRSTCICFSSTTFYCWPESKKHRARSVHIYALMTSRSTEVAIGLTGVHNTSSTYRQSVFKCQSNATIGLLLRWPSVSEIAMSSYWLALEMATRLLPAFLSCVIKLSSPRLLLHFFTFIFFTFFLFWSSFLKFLTFFIFQRFFYL